jgi:hypothetical protein
MSGLKALFARLRLAWRLSVSPHASTLVLVAGLLDSPIYEGALFACRKGQADRDIKAAGNELLRSQAVEWSYHWYRDRGMAPHPWQVRLAIELAVGELKGHR